MTIQGGVFLAAALNGNGAYPVMRRERLSNHEMRYINERRRSVRASWQDCAAMVDRSVHDVRMACDPDYSRANGGVTDVVIGRARLELDGSLARVLMVIASTKLTRQRDRRRVPHGPTAGEITLAFDCSGQRVEQWLGKLNAGGYVERHRDVELAPEWALTALGRDEVVRQIHAMERAAHG